MSVLATSRSTKWGIRAARTERQVAPYIYAGLQLIHPRLLAGMPDGAFSMNRAWDTALAAGPLARGRA